MVEARSCTVSNTEFSDNGISRKGSSPKWAETPVWRLGERQRVEPGPTKSDAPEEGIKSNSQQELPKLFVHFLYQGPAFDAFDNFSNFLESISCETSKTCQVHAWFESMPGSHYLDSIV